MKDMIDHLSTMFLKIIYFIVNEEQCVYLSYVYYAETP